MNYYIDTEFLEGIQKRRFLGMPYGDTPPTIDLISIGIVSEDGSREYYAISNEFNLKEAWYRYNDKPEGKVYWIRDNVLLPIYLDCIHGDLRNIRPFSLSNMEWTLSRYGKSRKQIAADIKEFVGTEETIGNWVEVKDKMNTNFYGYYSDYDWVAFCWLFGKMIDLPEGFPMFCIDLKQEFDNKANSLTSHELSRIAYPGVEHNVFSFLGDTGQLDCPKHLKKHKKYPVQENEHNALADARWNKKLYDFIKQL